MVFGIVGCNTIPKYPPEEQMIFIDSLKVDGWKQSKNIYGNNAKAWTIKDNSRWSRFYAEKKIGEKRVAIKTDGQWYIGTVSPEWAEGQFLMSFSAGRDFDLDYNKGEFFYWQSHDFPLLTALETACKNFYGLEEIDKDVTQPLNSDGVFIYPTIITASCLSKAEVKQKQMDRYTTKCKNYGFKDGTDALNFCVMQQIQNTENTIRSISQKIKDKALKQNIDSKKLFNLDALMLGLEVLNPTAEKTQTPSIQQQNIPTVTGQNYSFVTTVPSNQNCPITASLLIKQEVNRGNRICYYQ